jgi:hypothetical protein
LFDPPIGSVAPGQTAEIVARTQAGDWYQVRLQSGTAWVSAQLVTVSGDISQLPIDNGPPIPTLTTTPGATATLNNTAPVTVQSPQPTVGSTPPPTPLSATPGTVPAEAVVGGVLLLAVLTYVGFYWRGLAAGDRYAQGFVVDRCPVCSRGELEIETRVERWFGVPRPRRIVRCSSCRSVLRETGHRRWRYAVDPLENPALYKLYNGQEVDENTLVALRSGKPAPRNRPNVPPAFMDDDDRQS